MSAARKAGVARFRAAGEKGLWAVLMAAVVAFYAWTALSTMYYTWKIDGQGQGDYFNLLTDGFLDGHLYLKTEVSPALVTAENPYDPEKRPPGSALHDVSYYRGHYYLYFGVAPVVTLFLPFTLLTGADLPQYYGNVFFAAAGFVCVTGLFLRLRRRYFPAASLGLTVAALLVLGLGSMLHAVLRRPSFWELPIAAAYGFAMLALACAERALHARRSAGWMLGAGMSFGLAVGSRPTYAVAAPLLAIPLLLWWWEDRQAGVSGFLPNRRWWGRAFAVGAGLGLAALGLLWHNYARFGNPLEFGLNYQLTGLYEAKVTHFTPRFAPFNAFVYYWAPAQWSRYFPFVEVIRAPEKPEGYYGIEFVYGILSCLPVAWLALAAPLGLRGRATAERGRLLALLASVAALYLPLAAVMLFFVTAAARYMVDFTPALMLLGCCGMLALERLELPRWGRRSVRGLCGALAAVSIFFGTMASFQLHELLRINDAPTHQRLAHFFDGPSQWYEKLAGTRHGPLELRLRFPAQRPTERQLLLSTGWEFYSDHVFVYYPTPDLVQFGFVHSGEAVRLTEPLAVDFNAEHTLRIEAGSLYPPSEHPFFDGKMSVDVAAHTRWLQLVLDDRVIMEGPQTFFDASPGSMRLGGTGVKDRGYGYPFKGRIESRGRDDTHWMEDLRGSQGAIAFTVFFPREPPARNQPLVVSGEAGRADLLFARFEGPQTLRFGYDHWGYWGGESPPVPCDPARPHALEVRFGSLLPPARGSLEEALRASLVVKLDGAVVWSQRVPYYDIARDRIALAHNAIGASTCDAVFSGAIRDLRRLPEAKPAAVAAGRGPTRWQLQLMLPTGQTGRSEPLLASGAAGAGDALVVNYVDEHHVRFGHDHGGAITWQREPIAVDYRRTQELAVQWAPLFEASAAQGAEEGELAVTLNGANPWREKVSYYRATAETLAIGENRIGTKSCDAVFSGGMVEIGEGAGP